MLRGNPAVLYAMGRSVLAKKGVFKVVVLPGCAHKSEVRLLRDLRRAREKRGFVAPGRDFRPTGSREFRVKWKFLANAPLKLGLSTPWVDELAGDPAAGLP